MVVSAASLQDPFLDLLLASGASEIMRLFYTIWGGGAGAGAPLLIKSTDWGEVILGAAELCRFWIQIILQINCPQLSPSPRSSLGPRMRSPDGDRLPTSCGKVHKCHKGISLPIYGDHLLWIRHRPGTCWLPCTMNSWVQSALALCPSGRSHRPAPTLPQAMCAAQLQKHAKRAPLSRPAAAPPPQPRSTASL